MSRYPTITVQRPKSVQSRPSDSRSLAAKSDVLIENFVPGKLEALGLGFADLKEAAPGLIYCSLTGFGSDGPYK